MIVAYVLAFSSESDRDKFDLVFRKYRNLMLHKAYGILKDPYLAEDAVSEAFLRIYKNMHKISDPLSNQSIAFFVTIAENSALTMYRKSIRDKSEAADAETLENISDSGSDPEDLVVSDMSANDIYALIDGLNASYKQVFLLKYAHGCSLRDIASMLGMTEGNVAVTLHRARNVLKKTIAKEGLGFYERAATR